MTSRADTLRDRRSVAQVPRGHEAEIARRRRRRGMRTRGQARHHGAQPRARFLEEPAAVPCGIVHHVLFSFSLPRLRGQLRPSAILTRMPLRGEANESASNPTTRRTFLKTTGQAAAASALAGVKLPHVHAADSQTINVALIGCGGRGTGAAVNALLDTTFSNNPKTTADGSYQDYPAAGSPPWSGARSTGALGYDGFFRDGIYRLQYTFEHSAGSVTINFSSSLFEGKGTEDEAWGLDNVIVSLSSALGHSRSSLRSHCFLENLLVIAPLFGCIDNQTKELIKSDPLRRPATHIASNAYIPPVPLSLSASFPTWDAHAVTVTRGRRATCLQGTETGCPQ